MLPVIVLGGGGHARVLIDALMEQSRQILGYTHMSANTDVSIYGTPCLGTDQVIANYSPYEIQLVNAVGSVGVPTVRANIYEKYRELGFEFASVIHPSAVMSRKAELGQGVQVMAGAVIQAGARIGNNVIVNTHASVDHDCNIGDHTHLAPGVTLSGSVHIGESSHVGTGATVIQDIRVGANCVIGAGSVVVKHVPSNTVVKGVPGRERVK